MLRALHHIPKNPKLGCRRVANKHLANIRNHRRFVRSSNWEASERVGEDIGLSQRKKRGKPASIRHRCVELCNRCSGLHTHLAGLAYQAEALPVGLRAASAILHRTGSVTGGVLLQRTAPDGVERTTAFTTIHIFARPVGMGAGHGTEQQVGMAHTGIVSCGCLGWERMVPCLGRQSITQSFTIPGDFVVHVDLHFVISYTACSAHARRRSTLSCQGIEAKSTETGGRGLKAASERNNMLLRGCAEGDRLCLKISFFSYIIRCWDLYPEDKDVGKSTGRDFAYNSCRVQL